MEERFFKLDICNDSNQYENVNSNDTRMEYSADNIEYPQTSKKSTYLKSFIIRCIIATIIIACIYSIMSFMPKNNGISDKITEVFTVEYKIDKDSKLNKIADFIENTINSISNKINVKK